MFSRNKKKKKEVALSCPFCGNVFEDVSQHVLNCSGVNSSAMTTFDNSPSVHKPRPPTSPRVLPPSPEVKIPIIETPEPAPTPITPEIVKIVEKEEPKPKPKPNTPFLRAITTPVSMPKQSEQASTKVTPSSWKMPTSRSQASLTDTAEKEIDSEIIEEVQGEEEGGEEGEEEEIYGTVLFDYVAGTEAELTVYAGQRAIVLEQNDPEWTYVSIEGHEGFIARAYIEIEEKKETSTCESTEPLAPTISKKVVPNIPNTSSSHDIDLSGGQKVKKEKSSKFQGLRSLRAKKKQPEFSISRAETTNDLKTQEETHDSIHSTVEEEIVGETPPTISTDQRTNIVHEILSTETKYLNIINAMIERYRETLLYRFEAYGGSITKENVMEIFINLEMIIPINQQLHKDLDSVIQTWSPNSTVGDIFVRVAPFMKMYNQYSNQYDHALGTLTKCMKNENFLLLVEEIDGTAKLGSRLESLLIAPIQRIPRYTLLLKELRKATPDNHPDVEHLEKAIPLMQQVATYINSNISEVENQEKLLSLSLAGAQSLLKPHRVLLHEGIVNDGKKKYHIWLFNDIIVQLPDALSKNKDNLNKPKYQWPLHLVWMGDSSAKSKTQATFGITGPTASYVFSCLIEEATVWVTKITEAQKQHLEYLSVTQDLQLAEEKAAVMTFENPNRFGNFVFPNKATYTGWWREGYFEGSGTYTFFGCIYVGTFSKSLKEGKGTFTFSFGAVYCGDWKNDRQNGHGILTYPNGDSYDGYWVEGLKHGKGALTCSMGDTYIGEWSNDVPQGLGEMAYSSGMLYNGNWENGMRNHYGILISPTGERYEGDWVAGVRSGKGRMEYSPGNFYDGFWKDGHYHGRGKFISSAGKYEGEFVHGLKEGNGTFVYTNGREYNGQWKRGLYHGQGKLTCLAGFIKSYNGDWVQQKRHGQGTLTLFNGHVYEGNFKDNKFHGSGQYSFGNDFFLKCKFSRGAIIGECVFTRPMLPNEKKKDNIYTGMYKGGMLISSDATTPPIYIPTIPCSEIDLF